MELTGLAERFWPRVRQTDSCWAWTGTTISDGRGVLWWKGKTWTAPRLSWLLHFGDLPKDVLVCHHCDNPNCVRPDHLFTGSQSDNMYDASAKHRIASARLSREVAEQIRREYIPRRVSYATLGARYGVDRTAIYQIVKGTIYPAAARAVRALMETRATPA